MRRKYMRSKKSCVKDYKPCTHCSNVTFDKGMNKNYFGKPNKDNHEELK